MEETHEPSKNQEIITRENSLIGYQMAISITAQCREQMCGIGCVNRQKLYMNRLATHVLRSGSTIFLVFCRLQYPI